jgi:hypothetical protein
VGCASEARLSNDEARPAFQIIGDGDSGSDAKLRGRETTLSLTCRGGGSVLPALRDIFRREAGLGGRAMLAPAAES